MIDNSYPIGQGVHSTGFLVYNINKWLPVGGQRAFPELWPVAVPSLHHSKRPLLQMHSEKSVQSQNEPHPFLLNTEWNEPEINSIMSVLER